MFLWSFLNNKFIYKIKREINIKLIFCLYVEKKICGDLVIVEKLVREEKNK